MIVNVDSHLEVDGNIEADPIIDSRRRLLVMHKGSRCKVDDE
jgi:hypothetical protein